MALPSMSSVISFFILFPFLESRLSHAVQPAVGLLETDQAIVERNPQTVDDQDGLSKLDDFARQLMASANAPGAQLAVAKGGELKYFKGFGLANIDTNESVTTQSVMRYYSMSKSITGTAILKLVEEGRLRLDEKPFLILKDVAPPKNSVVDPRLFDITVQNLLQHSGGWNKTLNLGFDPALMPSTLIVSNSLGTPVPATAYDQIRYMKSVALDFDPGTAYEYSNFGYNVLGRVIEKVTGMNYADYVKKHLFHVAGVKGMKICRSRVRDLEPNEVRYYGVQGQVTPTVTVSVFPGEGYVPASYGGADCSKTDSFGGWLGNAAQAVKFLVHVDGLRKPAILGREMVHEMLNARRPSEGSMDGGVRGLQWFVGEVEKGQLTLVLQNGGVKVFYHDGGAPGGISMSLRLVKEKISMAFLLNSEPIDYQPFVAGAIVNFTNLVASIKEWPHHDLF